MIGWKGLRQDDFVKQPWFSDVLSICYVGECERELIKIVPRSYQVNFTLKTGKRDSYFCFYLVNKTELMKVVTNIFCI